jgi:hypothetical protein
MSRAGLCRAMRDVIRLNLELQVGAHMDPFNCAT